MDETIYCIECHKYFDNLESFNKLHNHPSYQVMNVKHNYLRGKLSLSYISNLYENNGKILEEIKNQNIQIQQIISKLNYYEDALKNDVCFDCNICLKNVENQIQGNCLIHFFPKCIHFKIEYNGNIKFEKKNEFEIEILFPFKIAETKTCSIEKIQGCISNQKVLNLSEQETIIFHNYNPYIIQKNYITSIKLMKNYYSTGFFEKNKLNIAINGILTFSSFKYDLSLPFILYNINQKKFICYENYQWKFHKNCFLKEGKIDNNFIINIEFNSELNGIYIKNKYKYLGNKNNFVTTNKNEAKFNLDFINKFYGIITIDNNGLFLSSDFETEQVKLSNEKNYYIIYNV